MTWRQAIETMRDSRDYYQRLDATERILTDIDRLGDEGTETWIMEGQWFGTETPESILAELAEIEDY